MTDDDDPEGEALLDALAAETRLSDEVRAALHSPLWQLLLQRAEAEAKDAYDRWLDVDPHDADAVRRLQNQGRRLRDMQAWIAETTERSAAAFEELMARERAAGRIG